MQNQTPSTDQTCEFSLVASTTVDLIATDCDGNPALLGGKCTVCGTAMFPKTTVCPTCASEAIDDRIMPRRGILYSFTDVYVGFDGLEKPVFLGYVDLPNGARIFTHLRKSSVALAIGQEVELRITEERGTAKRAFAPFVFSPVENA